jgi:starch synthase
MKILLVSSEAIPFAKTGGLADVSGALPKALARLGQEVTLILPKYRQVDEKRFPLKKTSPDLMVPVGQRLETAEVFAAQMEPNYRALLIRKDSYYDRENLYGSPSGDYEDNAERFVFFCRAVLEAARVLKPDLIHCHDWQSALVPIYLKTLYRSDPLLARVPSVFTIHNIAYQGLFWHYDLPLTNLGWELFTPQALEFYGKLNFLKGGIVFADAVTTVSRKYMEEIQSAEFGAGLEGVLRDRHHDLHGILNGVDYDDWSPAKDPFIRAKYDPQRLSGKKACKADLQKEFGLPVDDQTPVIGIISRLTEQKGFDLITAVMDDLMKESVQLIILGTGDEKYHLLLDSIAKKNPRQIGLKIAFDNALAHKIEAGADLFLMPSRFEPCGLNQIYSLKYGTVPIVRAVGGLDDTIEDYHSKTQGGNGFKFKDYSPSGLFEAIRRALRVYRDRSAWEKLMLRGMIADFSWDRSARAYLELYQDLARKKTSA